jgi:hypothetical protein
MDPSNNVVYYNGKKGIGPIDFKTVTMLKTDLFSEMYIRVFTTTNDKNTMRRAE